MVLLLPREAKRVVAHNTRGETESCLHHRADMAWVLIRQKTRARHFIYKRITMSTELKERVFNYIDGRVHVSAKGIGDALGITVQRAGRYIRSLVDEGRVKIDHVHDAVPYYRTCKPSEQTRATVDVTEAHSKDTPEIVKEIGDAAIKGMITSAEKQGYDKGFTRGYEVGRNEACREAYADGQLSVFERIKYLVMR